MTKAKLFTHFAFDPYFNMAFDEWMVQQVNQTPQTALFRLYSWNPSAITIGFHQTINKALDINSLGRTCLIRRITGGRAIYHDQGELTYSIALSTGRNENLPNYNLRKKWFDKIAVMLSYFLELQGYKPTIAQKSYKSSNGIKDKLNSLICFDSMSKYEIKIDEKKVIASAQRILGNVLFQHGSIKLNGVASHPALKSSVNSCEESISELEELNFKQATCDFVTSIEKKLAFSLETSENSHVNNMVKETLNRFREKAQKKRHIF